MQQTKKKKINKKEKTCSIARVYIFENIVYTLGLHLK